MAFLIGLPILIIAVCMLFALIYSLFIERDKRLLLKERYEGKHQIRRIRR